MGISFLRFFDRTEQKSEANHLLGLILPIYVQSCVLFVFFMFEFTENKGDQLADCSTRLPTKHAFCLWLGRVVSVHV